MKTNINSTAAHLRIGRGGTITSSSKNIVSIIKDELNITSKGYGLNLGGIGADGIYGEKLRLNTISSSNNVVQLYVDNFIVGPQIKFSDSSNTVAVGNFQSTSSASIDVTSVNPSIVSSIDIDTTVISLSYNIRFDSWEDFAEALNCNFEKDNLPLIATISSNTSTKLNLNSTSDAYKFNLVELFSSNYGTISYNSENEIFQVSDRIENVGIYAYEEGWNATAFKTWCYYDGEIYLCISNHTTGASFDVTKWQRVPNIFQGATASKAGKQGIVPKPAAGDQGKFLKGDGTWTQLQFNNVANLPQLNNQVQQNSTDIDSIQQTIAETEHFRGYYATTAEIQALTVNHNGDYAYNAQTGTKWIFNGTSWQNSGVKVPNQTVPKSTSSPLMDGTASAGSATAYAAGDHRHPTDTTRAALSGNNTFSGTNTFTGVCTFSQAIRGTALKAKWADLAEYYEADADYPKGTLVKFGGDKEVTIADDVVNAVVSSAPALSLNSECDGLPIALVGRVPVRVIGKCHKFDYLELSEIPGVARACKENVKGSKEIIARVLEDKNTEEEGLVLCVVRFSL